MSRIHTCTPGHVSYGWIFADTRDREATITLTPQHIHASQHPRSHAVKRAAGACSVQATATARTQRGPAVRRTRRRAPRLRGVGAGGRRAGAANSKLHRAQGSARWGAERTVAHERGGLAELPVPPVRPGYLRFRQRKRNRHASQSAKDA
jgi:hypothetical protein